MPKAYSQDLREKAIAAVDHGEPKSTVIQMFQISRDRLARWLKHRETTGNVQAITGYQRGHRHCIVDWTRFQTWVEQHGDKPKPNSPPCVPNPSVREPSPAP